MSKHRKLFLAVAAGAFLGTMAGNVATFLLYFMVSLLLRMMF